MYHSPVLPIKTKRVLLAHVSLCSGCCCGAVQKGNAEVPVEWMKDQWKKCGLRKSIQLTISGCLGPCDVSNVATISSAGQTLWLGRLREFANYAALLKWALDSRDAECVLPLPGELSELRFDPFPRTDSALVVSTVFESVDVSS
jgi:cobaltochelatase CobN